MAIKQKKQMSGLVFAGVMLAGYLVAPTRALAEPEMCTYSTYKWNVNKRRAVEFVQVSHPYSELAAYEIEDAFGCTICREDQVEIKIEGVKPFYLCKYLAADIKAQLSASVMSGEIISSVTGYRVGMTRGKAGAEGNRTGFSNHSFGIAVDINEAQNGLYDHCFQFGEQCQLRKGGAWSPDQDGSLTADGPIVRAIKRIGLKWGGEIAGRQKDFMHFSPSGY